MLPLDVKTHKNLLAFSGGVDSTALFFLLMEQNIPFDIAIVNYNRRKQAKHEVVYALSLALKYKKQCFIHDVHLEDSNFEHTARQIRYEFFEEIIEEYKYETLLTAHQLNDKLEWFFMQLSRGAGLSELLGLNERLEKPNYTILRPLLNVSKATLEAYLIGHKIKYFYDESNHDTAFTRNYFREEFCCKFIQKFEQGVQKSFQYLNNDLNSLNIAYTPLFIHNELEVFKNHHDDNLNIRIIDASLKKRGYVLSYAQRQEIRKQKEGVISNWAIQINSLGIFICPRRQTVMPKKFKEACREYKIPKKIRAYLCDENIEIKQFYQMLLSFN
jgi:tRNA(Ile)-lysidine synthase